MGHPQDSVTVLNSLSVCFPFCIVGAMWIVSGVRAIRTQKASNVRWDLLFRLEEKPIVAGRDAVGMGRFRIGVGVLLIAIGLWPILSILL